MSSKINDSTSFNKKIKKTANCWIWKGTIDKSTGYGFFCCNYKNILAHRFSYVLHRGKIPMKLQIDHLCRNRKCVNPEHLEAVTQRENILRGIAPPAINARKSHCINGHPLIGKNLIRDWRGDRACKKCAYKSNNRRRKIKYWLKKALSENLQEN